MAVTSMTYSINIIGAGRLGQHWLTALQSQNNILLQQVVSRHLKPHETKWPVVNHLSELKPANITLICVADDELQAIINQLVTYIDGSVSPIIIHCAGRFSSDLLSPLAAMGCSVASVHPLRAFTRHINKNAFHDCPISLEGDQHAVDIMAPLLKQLGANPFIIDKDQKTRYHSACALASNGLVGLVETATQLFHDCGIERNQAKELSMSLIASSLTNCQQTPSLSDALTGPIARGDKDTVTAHLAALDTTPNIKALYFSLSQQILSLVNKEASLDNWLMK